MGKIKLIFLFAFISSMIYGQDSYTKMTDTALKEMWYAKDSLGFKKALNLYEEAFDLYPDSIDGLGLYKASVLAGELGELDKAFKYLTPLAQTEMDENGYPGWIYIVGGYADREYANLLEDPRWKALEEQATVDKARFYKGLKDKEDEFFATAEVDHKRKSGSALYKDLQSQNHYLPKKHSDYSISLQINDSTQTSYLVHLPENYSPKNEHSVLVFLHGAVRRNSLADYLMPENLLGGWNRYYTKYAEKNDVILVFLKGGKQYNWMYPDDGFFMVPEVIRQIKKSINIDDNKVFISGHSNGATGSFSYLMKQPTMFAGMYGFNTHPKVYTGGTFIENIKNRSFINISTDQDYYYPPEANDSLTAIMESMGANYKDHRYNGFPHWFPEFDESESAYEIIFEDIRKRERNPFPKVISWELDNIEYGEVDWISDIRLDTTASRASWHRNLNFKIHKWYDYNDQDSLVAEDVDMEAFNFPYKSGKILGSYDDNTFKIETSCVKSFQINISPEMVDMNREVQVFLNGKLYLRKKVDYDSDFMLHSYDKSRDRKQIWVDRIIVDVE